MNSGCPRVLTILQPFDVVIYEWVITKTELQIKVYETNGRRDLELGLRFLCAGLQSSGWIRKNMQSSKDMFKALIPKIENHGTQRRRVNIGAGVKDFYQLMN